MKARQICFLISILLYAIGINASVGSTHGLAIVSEYGENETLAVTLDQDPSIPLALGHGRPAGIGAASKLLLTALYQGVPVLAPAPLWDTIIEHKRLFDTATQLNGQTLYQSYGNSKRFAKQGALEEFREQALYLKHRYEKIKHGLTAPNPYYDVQQLVQQDVLFNFESAPDSVKKMDGVAWNEISSYLMCSAVPVDQFVVREITLPQEPDLPFYVFIPKKQFAHYDRQRTLGLKVDDYPSVRAIFTPKTYPEDSRLKYPALLAEVLKALFVTKDETAATSVTPHRWSMFLMGHGSYCDHDPSAVKIAGMSLQEFRKILMFLESSIDTRLFFYVSCSAGGKNFIDAFKQDGQAIQLSYPVFAYALTEGASLVASPFLRLDFFADDKIEGHLAKLIDWDKKQIIPDAPYDIAQFFALSQQSTCTPETIDKLIKSLNPSHRLNDGSFTNMCRLADHEANNATSVRLPLTSSFRVVSDETFVPLYCTSVAGQTFYHISERKELVLLYDSDIPYTLKFAHDGQIVSLPPVISLVPGKAAHIINRYEAPYAPFSHVVKNFFACQKLQVPKLFHIKRLLCAQDERSTSSVELSDVLFFNYVPSYLVTSLYLQSMPTAEFCNGVIARKGGQTCLFLWNTSDPAPTITTQQLTTVPGGLFNEAIKSYFNTTPSCQQDGSNALVTVDELTSHLRSYYT